MKHNMLNTAILLAGGFGTRLQSVVSDLPKPMAPMNGAPFLSYQLKYLKHFGFKKVILSVGHLSEKITAYFQNNFEGLEISYAEEKSPLGTGGGIRLAIEQCGDPEALVLNGDSFFDINLHDFFGQHQLAKSQFSLALRQVEDAARYGTIETDSDSRIISFKEKTGEQQGGLINGGVYILNKELFLKHTPQENNFSIEKDFFEKKLNNFIVKGFEFNGYFIDIGIPEDYNKAQNDFKGFKYR
ncbi:MAG: nucleotidyltransferase family protein [Bacteroidota bacterium]